MPIFHRYILKSAIWHIAIAWSAIIGLRTIMESLSVVDNLMESGGSVSLLLKYAVLMIPGFTAQLLPMIALAGIVIAMARTLRQNEFTALRASGVSLRFCLLPVLLLPVAVSVLGYFNEEVLMPALEKPLNRVEDEIRGETVREHKNLLVSLSDGRTMFISRLLESSRGVVFKPVEFRDTRSGLVLIGSEGVLVWNWLFLFDSHREGEPGFRRYQVLTLPISSEQIHQPSTELRCGEVVIRSEKTQIKKKFSVLIDAQIAEKGGVNSINLTYITCGLWREEPPAWYLFGTTREIREEGKLPVIKPVRIEGERGIGLVMKTPAKLRRQKLRLEWKSYGDLKEIAEAVPRLKRKLMVSAWSKVLFPLASIVVVLAGLPFLFQYSGKGGVWVGVGLAFLVCVSFYVCFLFLRDITAHGRSAVFDSLVFLPGTLSVVLFGTVGVYLVARTLR